MWAYWILFSLIAALTGFISLVLGMAGRKQQTWMLISLTFTVLYMLAKYDMAAHWVIRNDWSALGDVVPSMNWRNQLFCVVVLLMNCIPVVRESLASVSEWIEKRKSR